MFPSTCSFIAHERFSSLIEFAFMILINELDFVVFEEEDALIVSWQLKEEWGQFVYIVCMRKLDRQL
jgi:hypothetical protein